MAPLPPKQNGIFKKVLKCYDYKQYKMGLKLIKQILSNPETANHGETLAMKGLILNCMGKKDEAYEFVRKGLRNDLTSHVCWHVYGLLQRSEHKYDEAIKCYRNALKYDKDNITILRDLSLLQIQMRDLEGFRDTRYQLFMLRSAQRVSWLSFAVAYHLLKDYSTATKILDEYTKTQKDQTKPSNGDKNYREPIDYEQSELLLYEVMIMSEAGNYKEAYEFLNRNTSKICDRLAVLEAKVELLLALGRNVECTRLIEDNLIARNQENYLYYQQLEKALNLDPNDEEARLNVYKSIQEKYPRSRVPFKIPLNFVHTPKLFTPLVDKYLRNSITRSLPALFRNIKPIYNYEYDKMVDKLNQEYLESKENKTSSGMVYIESTNDTIEARKIRADVLKKHGNPTKVQIIEDLMLGYEKNLIENSSFESEPSTKGTENKTSVLWVYYYLAQHYDHVGLYEKAHEYVRKAVEHTPTLIELLTLKGKIYKHQGEFDKAAEQVNEAQRLDTADRYLNSKCAKYLLRANKVSQAEDMCSKFTRAGVSVTENLNEMQCMWFQKEAARAYWRQNMYGLALRKCYEIDAYFTEVTEDQFDFHTYCMRKMTLRSYIRLLRLEDVLRSHRFYFDAAEIAIKIYIKLHDEPLVDGQGGLNGKNGKEELSASELRKIKNKERKAAAKSQQNNKQNKAQNNDGDTSSKVHSQNNANNHSNNTKDQTTNNNDTNKQSQNCDNIMNQAEASALDPKILEHPSDPLDKAIRFLRPLMILGRERIETHLLAFEVYRRRNKLLLMLRSVKRAKSLDPYHSEFIKQRQQFLEMVAKLKKDNSLPDLIAKVLEVELPKIQIQTKTKITSS